MEYFDVSEDQIIKCNQVRQLCACVYAAVTKNHAGENITYPELEDAIAKVYGDNTVALAAPFYRLFEESSMITTKELFDWIQQNDEDARIFIEKAKEALAAQAEDQLLNK